MRRTTILGLVAGLVAALVLTTAPATVPSASAAASANRGWTTVHQRVGAKIQVCQHRESWGWGLEMRLDARKASFAPMEDAVRLTGMEYGGITPIGLPADWPVYVDSRIPSLPRAIVGSGLRASKIALSGDLLAALPGAEVIDGLAR